MKTQINILREVLDAARTHRDALNIGGDNPHYPIDDLVEGMAISIAKLESVITEMETNLKDFKLTHEQTMTLPDKAEGQDHKVTIRADFQGISISGADHRDADWEVLIENYGGIRVHVWDTDPAEAGDPVVSRELPKK